MIEFRDALTDLLEEFGTDDHGTPLLFCLLLILIHFLLAESQAELPEPKSMRVEHKTFYFDVGQNRRGTFMRISEVCGLPFPYLCYGYVIPLFHWDDQRVCGFDLKKLNGVYWVQLRSKQQALSSLNQHKQNKTQNSNQFLRALFNLVKSSTLREVIKCSSRVVFL
jgi:hypothetical protein